MNTETETFLTFQEPRSAVELANWIDEPGPWAVHSVSEFIAHRTARMGEDTTLRLAESRVLLVGSQCRWYSALPLRYGVKVYSEEFLGLFGGGFGRWQVVAVVCVHVLAYIDINWTQTGLG